MKNIYCLIAVLSLAWAVPVPTPQQLTWASYEIGAMISYEMYSFYPNTSAYWIPPPTAFDPVDLDMDSWIQAAVAFNAKYAVLTTKHDSGFCLWPTTYPDYNYSVKFTNWSNGKGDLVADFINSCAKYNVLPAFYYSVATNFYKNITSGVPMDGNKTQWQEYNKIVEYQLTELLSTYPQVMEIWFDGGLIPPENGGPNVIPIIQKYTPDAVVFNSPPNFEQCIRWVGNEQGIAYDPNWSTCSWPGCTRGSGSEFGDSWCPAEIDTPLRDNGRHDWFWLPDGGRFVKTIDQLMTQYVESVGRNGNYLLNIAPNNRGTIDSVDMQRYIEFGTTLSFYGNEYALASTSGSGVRLDLAVNQWIDTVIIMEDQTEGEMVTLWALLGQMSDGSWKELSNGTSIGHKKIKPIGAMEVQSLSLVVLESWGNPVFDFFGAYLIN